MLQHGQTAQEQQAQRGWFGCRYNFRRGCALTPVGQHKVQVITANIYDSLFSTDKLDCSVVQVLGTAVTESTATAGMLDVNVAEISDDSDAADSLEGAIDNAGDVVAANVTEISDDVPAEVQNLVMKMLQQQVHGLSGLIARLRGPFGVDIPGL